MSDVVNTTTPAAPAKRVTKKATTKAKAKVATKAKAKAATKKAEAYAPREGSKVALLLEAMRTPKGIATEEAAKRFKWETKSIRGVISGTLKAKMGLTIHTEWDDKRGNVYRIKR